MTFKRITVNPKICGGKPIIRGLRFPASRLLGLLATGETAESIVLHPFAREFDFDPDVREFRNLKLPEV